MKVKKESEKVGLKLSIEKTKIMASGPITSWQIDGETVETVSDFILGVSKICCWDPSITGTRLKMASSFLHQWLPLAKPDQKPVDKGFCGIDLQAYSHYSYGIRKGECGIVPTEKWLAQ